MSITLFFILFSLLLSALFSGAEIAFISSNKLFFEFESGRSGFRSSVISRIYKKSDQFVVSMQIGNIAALVIFGLLIAGLLSVLLEPYIDEHFSLFLQVLIAGFIVFLCGELIPTMFSRFNPELFLSYIAIPMYFFFIILTPVTSVLSGISYFLLKIFRVKNQAGLVTGNFGKEELDRFIQKTMEDSSEKSELESEVKFVQNALEFSNVKVRSCIVPRTEIVAFEIGTSIDELVVAFIESGLSKILIYKEDIDNVVGYIHSSEMFSKPKDWTSHINPVLVVPENMSANTLMKSMLRKKKSMAVVIDEFGGTSGVVTLEDLVEEIFGEIEDEHDTKSQVTKKISETEYVFSGRVEIDKINEEFNLNLPESDEYVSVAGYILNRYRNFPKLNETITIDGFTFKIVKVTNTKIELVKLKIADNSKKS